MTLEEIWHSLDHCTYLHEVDLVLRFAMGYGYDLATLLELRAEQLERIAGMLLYEVFAGIRVALEA